MIIAIAAVAPVLWRERAEQMAGPIRQRPSAEHWLGTDALGRDMFWQTIVASRTTLEMAALATMLAACLGILLGAVVAAATGPTRSTGARLIDLLLSYPPVITALAVTAIFSPGFVSVVFAIGVAFSPQFARLTNRLALSVGERDYVVAARQLGVGRWRTVVRHVVPNIAGPLLVLTSVGFASSVLVISGLSFLGLGVQPPSYDWGSLLSSGLRNLHVNPGEAFGPAVAILLTGLAAGLVGDGLVRYQDPRRLRAVGQPRANVRDAPPLSLTSASEPAPGVVSVRDLTIRAHHGETLVHNVSFDVNSGEILGIVGESGSGKSLTSLAVARLLPHGLLWSASRLTVAGRDVSDPARPAPRALATDVGIVFQDPSASLNPALRISVQLTEVLRVHRKASRRDAESAAVAGLREVRVSSPEMRMGQYPHELSGGMRQRAMIAGALLSRPKVLIADEPTTALDVTVQAEVLRVLKQINTDHGTAILLISHDIDVVSALCDRICVMFGGQIVEELTVEALRRREVEHPYTRQLLAASPRQRTKSPVEAETRSSG